ncbi:cointegrate resolution protein, partial [mine drainage metagenome]
MSSPAGTPATESPSARRSAPISREAVFDAAWALTKAGSRPTIERIRLYLGNGTPRGSPNTVNTFLTQWWEQLAVRVAGGPVEAIPGLPPSVSATLETLWNQALVAAKEKWRDELAGR